MSDDSTRRMRFCRECNHLLVPRENKELKKLEFVCTTLNCGYVDTTFEGSCVYVQSNSQDTSTRLETVLSDLNKDPTLQRSDRVECIQCGHNEAVFFQADQTKKATRLMLVYICTECGIKWMD
jgi:DNA-directed RNA polymerase II subunit RPB9